MDRRGHHWHLGVAELAGRETLEMANVVDIVMQATTPTTGRRLSMIGIRPMPYLSAPELVDQTALEMSTTGHHHRGVKLATYHREDLALQMTQKTVVSALMDLRHTRALC